MKNILTDGTVIGRAVRMIQKREIAEKKKGKKEIAELEKELATVQAAAEQLVGVEGSSLPKDYARDGIDCGLELRFSAVLVLNAFCTKSSVHRIGQSARPNGRASILHCARRVCSYGAAMKSTQQKKRLFSMVWMVPLSLDWNSWHVPIVI